MTHPNTQIDMQTGKILKYICEERWNMVNSIVASDKFLKEVRTFLGGVQPLENGELEQTGQATGSRKPPLSCYI